MQMQMLVALLNFDRKSQRSSAIVIPSFWKRRYRITSTDF